MSSLLNRVSTQGFSIWSSLLFWAVDFVAPGELCGNGDPAEGKPFHNDRAPVFTRSNFIGGSKMPFWFHRITKLLNSRTKMDNASAVNHEPLSSPSVSIQYVVKNPLKKLDK
jgi:hypothetical protein